MMNFMRLLFLSLVLFLGCGAPRDVATQVTDRVAPVDFFVDPAGKTYLLLADSRLITRNELGQTTNLFYDSSLGMPDHVDVTNPFSIIVYYLDFGRLIILDRTLSEVARVDLFAVNGLEQPGALARANDNQIWVYDSWDYRLKLLNERGRVQRTTNDLRLELKITDAPEAIFVDRGTVALYFEGRNQLAVLTNYGRFQYWVDLPATTHVDYLTPYLLGYDEGRSWRWVSGAKTVKPYARPQVQSEGEQKRLPYADGYYLLTKVGTIDRVKEQWD